MEFSAFLEQQRDPESVSVALVSTNLQLFSIAPHPLGMLRRAKWWNAAGVPALAAVRCNSPFAVGRRVPLAPVFPVCRSEGPLTAGGLRCGACLAVDLV